MLPHYLAKVISSSFGVSGIKCTAPLPEYWNKGSYGQFWGAHGERVERKPIAGVWGQSPQLGPGAEPLVRSMKAF